MGMNIMYACSRPQEMRSDPARYEAAVAQFLFSPFVLNGHPSQKSKSDVVVDRVLTALVGSREIRQGAVPDAASKEVLRSIISWAVERQEPVPMLCPIGPKKPGDQRMDIAELCLLKTLESLTQRVRKVYEPGAKIRVRLEDLTGLVLEGPEAQTAMHGYCTAFETMTGYLNLRGPISVVRESYLVRKLDFLLRTADLTPLMRYGLIHSDSKALQMAGWTGGLPPALVQHVGQRVRKLHPDYDEPKVQDLIAAYFASALARRQLGATGAYPDWEKGAIVAYFGCPAPEPPELSRKRIYYRITPVSISKRHVPPWRGHGLLRAYSSGNLSPTVVPFGEEPPELEPGVLLITGEHGPVHVGADYVVA